MATITILPDHLISKIAAGEVIERPASVIKECVENSLDAGATSIEIHLKDAGKSLIHIKDNGTGISQNDLEKLFFRHATSKIKNEDDLSHINSLGFRGEALYSIGAISDVTLKSKTLNQSEGWEIHVRGTQRLSLKPAATTLNGTEIEIKELFFNTPARKKFLKSNTTEINQILNILIPYTLLHYKTRFLLTHQGSPLIDLPTDENLTKRIAQALHIEEKYILEKKYPKDQNDMAIQIVLGDINIKRARRDLQFLFINGRPVQHKNISFHLNQVYRLIMPPTDYPFFYVDILIPPNDVDVNVHPTKREVKLKDEQHLCMLLRNITEEILMKNGQIKEAASSFSPAHTFKNTTIRIKENKTDSLEPWEGQSEKSRNNNIPHSPSISEQLFFIPEANFHRKNKENLQSRLQNAKFIGGFLNKYLLFEENHSLLLIDQHAAAERVNYEKFLNQIRKGQIEVQHLLTPITLKLTPQEFLTFEEIKDTLEKIGFSNNQWDATSIAIHSHPIFIKNIERAIRNLLAERSVEKYDMDAIARRACRSSVMTGDKLQDPEAEKLKQQLIECFDPFTCPHGRPTVVELTEDFLDKQFLR